MERYVDEGMGRRAVGKTNMNAESSRSHSVFTVVVERDGAGTDAWVEGGKKTFTAGKLSLVDLAGSERGAKTGATGQAAKEGSAINKSLAALGDVIKALETKAKREADPDKDKAKGKVRVRRLVASPQRPH